MINKVRNNRNLLARCAILAILVACGIHAGATELFGAPSQAGSATPLSGLSEPGVIRRRVAALNLESLGPEADRAKDGVKVSLFPGVTFNFRAKRIITRSATSHTWFGSIDGHPGAEACFSMHEGALAGQISIRPGETYELSQPPGRACEVRQMSAPANAPEGDCVLGDSKILQHQPGLRQNLPLPGGAAPPEGDDGTVHDFVLLYTQALLDARGGLEGLTAAANLAVDWTNQAYANSQIPLTLRMVHAALTDYAETGDRALDLDRLHAPSEG